MEIGKRQGWYHDVVSKWWIGNTTIACFLWGILFWGILSPPLCAKQEHAGVQKSQPCVRPSCATKNAGARHAQHTAITACLAAIKDYLATLGCIILKPCSWNILDPDFLQLAERLQKLYFLSKTKALSVEHVQSALKQFQRMHKLAETGLLDQSTLACLNGDQKIMLDALRQAEKKWRDVGPLPEHYAMTNIPAFSLSLVVHGKEVLQSRVMVGKLDSKTPIFSGFIYSIVLNPTWFIPPKMCKMFMPYIGQDGYAFSQGRLVQKPGPKNHLGQIKFLTRRPDAIIFHSTNEPELFAHDVRAYSWGCVRVQDFKAMGAEILKCSGLAWDIGEILDKKIRKEVSLQQPFPVYVVYQTVWLDQDVLCIYPDIYGYNGSESGEKTKTSHSGLGKIRMSQPSQQKKCHKKKYQKK